MRARRASSTASGNSTVERAIRPRRISGFKQFARRAGENFGTGFGHHDGIAEHEISCLHTPDELDALLPEWTQLYEASGSRNPFADPRWLTILPDRELAPRWRQWPALPTFSHGGLSVGRM